MHSFEVHSNESACRKSGCLGLEQVTNGFIFLKILQHYITLGLSSIYPFGLNSMIQHSPIMRRWKNTPNLVLPFHDHYCNQGGILPPMLSFRVNKIDIDNQYELYSRTCAYGSHMIERFYITVSYVPVISIKSLCIIVSFSSAEFLIIFILDISNTFQNTILINSE